MGHRDDRFSGFVAVFNQEGGAPDERVIARPLAGLTADGPVQTSADGPCFAAAHEEQGPGRPVLVPRSGARGGMAVGIVRLDETFSAPGRWRIGPQEPGGEETARRRSNETLAGLALMADAVRDHGVLGPARLNGDFAFALYDPARCELVAARDPFGVKALFYAERDGHVLLASHASLLANGGYDEEYAATFLLGSVMPTSRTMYRGVRRVPPGGVLVAAPKRAVRITRYWTPRPAPDAPQSLADAADCFCERFTSCVRTRISPIPQTWAELSGGTDSSSIVVTADHLARAEAAPPLASTITYIDTLGEGDERRFALAVSEQIGAPHVVVANDWPWRDDGEPPPRADEPSPFYPFFARERRRARVIRRAGGAVLLSGLGSDHYLCGSLIYLADLLRRGRVVDAARDCLATACVRRTSVWRLARDWAFQPLMPAAIRYRGARAALRLPPWVPEAFARRHDLRSRLGFMRAGREGMPTRFQDGIAIEMEALEHAVRYKAFAEPIELRFPFLDRSLVELALGIPRECILRPDMNKVILREAMRGRLPDVVRLRSTKGGIDARILWALTRERARIDRLLSKSCLADMGAIDLTSLARAVEEARRGHVANTGYLLSTLALETWLAIQDGRWRVGHHGQAARPGDAA